MLLSQRRSKEGSLYFMSHIKTMSDDPLYIFESILGSGKKVGNEWEFPCPKCYSPHSLHIRPHKNWSFWCDGHGFSCGYTGGPATLIRDYGKELSNPLVILPTKDIIINWKLLEDIYSFAKEKGNLLKSHREWLKNRGLKEDPDFFSSDSIIEPLKRRYNPEELCASGLFYFDRYLKPCRVLLPNRLVIAYSQHNKTTYLRSRDMNPDTQDRYRAPRGVPQKDQIWGLTQLEFRPISVIVTEGEFKAAAAAQRGFAALGLPGMSNSHNGLVLRVVDAKIEHIDIIFDSDVRIKPDGNTKQSEVDYHSHRLKIKLEEARLAVCLIKLPLLGEEKMDLDRFLLLRETQGLLNLI